MTTITQKRITELKRIKEAPSRTKASKNGRRAKPLVGLRNILVPTDFSERSLDALAFAENVAELTGAKLTLINVVEPVVLPVPLTALAMDNDEFVRRANKKLKDLAAEHGIAPEMLDRVVVAEGAAWNEIVRAARNLKCDLIVIATQGRRGLEHAFLGSTAERVIRHAHCPVLVVK